MTSCLTNSANVISKVKFGIYCNALESELFYILGFSTLLCKIWLYFQESIKQRIQSLQQCASKSKNRFIWKLVLSKGTSSHHLFIMYSQAK